MFSILTQTAIALFFIALGVNSLKESKFTRQQNIKSLLGVFYFVLFCFLGIAPVIWFMPPLPEGQMRSDFETLSILFLILSYIALGLQFLVAYVPKGETALVKTNRVSSLLIFMNVLILLVCAVSVGLFWS